MINWRYKITNTLKGLEDRNIRKEHNLNLEIFLAIYYKNLKELAYRVRQLIDQYQIISLIVEIK